MQQHWIQLHWKSSKVLLITKYCWYHIVCFPQGEDSFGFHIRGGEKKTKQDEKWLVFHYTTPVFISHIVPGGVADR